MSLDGILPLEAELSVVAVCPVETYMRVATRGKNLLLIREQSETAYGLGSCKQSAVNAAARLRWIGLVGTLRYCVDDRNAPLAIPSCY
jgi:hypothetical protein